VAKQRNNKEKKEEKEENLDEQCVYFCSDDRHCK
jgi:hypothetical protein